MNGRPSKEDVSRLGFRGNRGSPRSVRKEHHIASYFNDYGDASETSASAAIAEIGARDGLAVMFHPGRYSYSVNSAIS